MDNRSEIRDFLSSRRARIIPEQAGLPTYGGNRRVPGLRREEVALLAGVSVDYYVRLERGNLDGVSERVLEALATYPDRDELRREYPELDDEDIRQALTYAAAAMEDRTIDLQGQ